MAKPLPDRVREDALRPAAWRRIAFWTLVLIVASFWVPTIPVEGEDPTAFTPPNLALLGVCVVLAALVLPAPWPVKLAVGGGLLGLTLLAWAYADPLRAWLGGAWTA